MYWKPMYPAATGSFWAGGMVPVPSARDMRIRALALDAGFRRLGIDRGEVMSWIRGRAVAPENEADHVLTDQFSPANLLLQQ